MNKREQNPVEWLESIAKSMIDNGADLGEDYPALLVHIQTAKQKEDNILQLLKDFDTWKEFKNDPDWLRKEQEKETTISETKYEN